MRTIYHQVNENYIYFLFSLSFNGDNNLVPISLWLFKRIHDIKTRDKMYQCELSILHFMTDAKMVVDYLR